MASCKYNPGINSVNPYAVLNVTQQSQNIANNTTTVRWELLIYRPSAISSSASKSWSVKVNGTTKSGTTTIGGSGTKSIASGTVSVPHNSDGTKSISFSFSLDFEINWAGKWIGTGSASGSMALTTIPRATTPTLSPTNVTMGNTLTINLPRASGSFTHTLYHDFYMGSWTQFASGVGTSATLEIPISWASRIPNAISGGGRIRCLTYNGGILIGEKIVNFTATIPTSVVPSVSSINVTETASLPITSDGFIQGKSKLKCVITAAGAQGSTIKSYSTKVGSLTYTGSSFTTDVIAVSGTVQIITTVTDSRGRTASKTQSITVLSYSQPVVVMSVFRANSAGSADEKGTYAVADVDIDITSLGSQNVSSYKIEYKKESDPDTAWLTAKSGSGYSIDTSYNLGNIVDADYSYNFRITVSDSFTTVIYNAPAVPTAFTIMDFRSNGKGVSFGKVSNSDMFDVGMEANFDKPLTVGGALIMNGGFKGISIKSGTDFNDLTTPGFYYSETSSVIESCMNYPEPSALSLEVYQASGVIQRATIYDNGTTCTRVYYNDDNTWSPWVKIIRAIDISDCIKLVETSTGSLTLDAFKSANVEPPAPTLSGYKLINKIGGRGNGNTGLMFSCGSGWVFNANNVKATFSSLTWYWLFVRNV